MSDLKQLLLELANDALEEAGNYGDAANLLCSMVSKDKELYDYIVDSALHKECSWAVHEVGRKTRSASWNNEQLRKASLPQCGDRLRKSTAIMSLYAFPTISGKPLKEANKGEVLHTASFYNKQAKDMRWKALWLYAVSDKMDDIQIVENCFTEYDLEELKNEVME